MSDCSTEAFKPKEWAHRELGLYYEETEGHETMKMSDKSSSGTPKTCGKCAKGTLYVQCCDNAALYGEGCVCDKHVPRSDTLEQRCQQLEQVARIMLKDYMEIYEIAEQRLGTYWMHQEFSSPKGIKKRLEDLGVSLDD